MSTESTRDDAVPEGFHREWMPDDRWCARPRSAGRCRYSVVKRKACGKPAVASLNRGRWQPGGRVDSWWDYCEDHLFGNRIIDGRVMSERLVPDA